MKKRQAWAALLGVVCIWLASACALGEEHQAPVLRVAFPQVPGMSETCEDGTRRGLVVDYLNEIAKYTGWEYAYVEVDDPAEMLENFRQGAYDLMGGQYYLPWLEEIYSYPDYHIGYSQAFLLARQDDQSIRSHDLASINGKTIGVYANAQESIRRLKGYLAMNHLDCPLRLYSPEELQRYGSLTPYLAAGEVDLILGDAWNDEDGLCMVASFNSQPYYIVTTPDNPEVLAGLNLALERIAAGNPYFWKERREANFPSLTAAVPLTDADRSYISNRGPVTVAVPKNWHPLYCLETADSFHRGLVPDILAEITAFTGLEFTYVYTKDYMEAMELVRQEKADLLAFFLGDQAEAAGKGLALTAPYIALRSIVVRNKASTYPARGLTCAVLAGLELPEHIQADRVISYKSLTEALSAVDRGEADFVYGLSARLEREIQLQHFYNVVPVSLANEANGISFALPLPADPDLLTLLNKAVNRLTPAKKTALIHQNMISLGASRFSMKAWINADPVAAAAILGAGGMLVLACTLLVIRWRTRSHAMQGELDRAEAESKAKGDFLSRMSHEIRTPMNAVVGLADLTCMMEGVPEGVRQNLFKLRASAQYLLGLINDILDMSRIDNGMLSIAKEPFDLTQVLDSLQSMMEPEAQRRGLRFTVDKRLSHDWLMGDAIRLRQVLTNLLSNAFKFTPEGGRVVMEVMEAAEEGPGVPLTFRVKDTGMGIGKEDQERIFDAFEQLGTSFSQGQGTGLGLSICRSIVEMMGGKLRVRSTPGKGSEFYFTLTFPLATREESGEGRLTSGLLAGRRILLAEDNDLNAEIAAQLLKLQGAEVCRCENGSSALKRFESSPPGAFQAILMDIQMPVMNGLEAARAIRALPRREASSIPILAMTANSFRTDKDAALAAGMNAFIPKPLNVNRLYQLLRTLIEKAEAG